MDDASINEIQQSRDDKIIQNNEIHDPLQLQVAINFPYS